MGMTCDSKTSIYRLKGQLSKTCRQKKVDLEAHLTLTSKEFFKSLLLKWKMYVVLKTHIRSRMGGQKKNVLHPVVSKFVLLIEI